MKLQPLSFRIVEIMKTFFAHTLLTGMKDFFAMHYPWVFNAVIVYT